MSTPPVAVVTFDVGDTLLKPWPSVGSIYSEVLASHGFRADPEQLDARFTKALKASGNQGGRATDEHRETTKWRGIVRQTVAELDGREFEKIFQDLWDTFARPERWQLRENARKTIDELRQRGFRTAILSNWDRRLRPLLQGFDLLNAFDALFISSEIGWEKPNPKIFKAAEKELQLPPEKILHVGDSVENDVIPAMALGWHSFLLSDTHEKNRSSAPRIGNLDALIALTPAV